MKISEICEAGKYNPDSETYRGERLLPITNQDVYDHGQQVGLDQYDDSYEQDDPVEKSQLSRITKEQLDLLTPRQRMVVKLRFFNDMTLEQVGARLGVTRDRVRQIEANALRLLRNNKVGKENPLVPFSQDYR